MNTKSTIVKITSTKKGIKISFPREFTIYQVQDIYGYLKENLDFSADMYVDMTATDEFDTSALQLLLAIRKELQTQGKQLLISASSTKVSEYFKAFNVSFTNKETNET